MRKSGLNQTVSVPNPSAVHIAAAITSYARIIINDYKNIPGNPCIMSGTDSAVLTYPLPNHLVGKGIGQMKLEHTIELGILIRIKLYYLKDQDNREVIKSSGIDSSYLNYNLFLNLLDGESIEVYRKTFNVEWKSLRISVEKSNIIIPGLIGKVKTIYNTPDVNFKFISFPKKYNLIVHPLYPVTLNKTEQTSELENKIKNNYNLAKLSLLEKLFIFIFLFSFLSVLSLFLYKIK